MDQSNCNKGCTFPDRAASREVRRNFVCTRSRQLAFRLYCFIAYRTPSPCVVQNANTHQCIANASCLRAPPRCERKSRWRKRECSAGQKKKWKNKHNQHDVQRQRQLKQQHDNQKRQQKPKRKQQPGDEAVWRTIDGATVLRQVSHFPGSRSNERSEKREERRKEIKKTP